MNSRELTLEISRTFGFSPTEEQMKALDVFAQFMFTPSSHSAMIMRGSAGTGKTSLAAAIVKTLKRLGQKVVLLAPTGRAAKVFALNSESSALTIHRKIYRQEKFQGVNSRFNLGFNGSKSTLFIVDEASMISDTGAGFSADDAVFGTSSLLDDLVRYVYSGTNCHLMLIGDKAQLPPVGESESPALEEMVLSGYGLDVFQCDMNEVLRQSQTSGILYNATMIRQMITHDEMTQLPRIHFDSFADISVVDGYGLIESINDSYSEVGVDETMIITRSNKRANVYNQGVRNRILECDDILCSGDRLMVVKNSYSWTEADKEGPGFLANGDIAVVRRVRNVQDIYGLQFADVVLRFPDYDDYEIELKVVLDSLMSDSPSLTTEQQAMLFAGVLEDYSDIRTKPEKMKAVREDLYYNAVQIKFAYAVTCHKAQGGQWEHVYLDQGFMTDEMLTPDYIHWLYTAFTRATKRLYLVNWPKTQIK